MHAALGVVNGFDMDSYIGLWGKADSFFRPFCQLQSGAGENVPKTGIFPLQRIVKTVKVKMPDGQLRQVVGLDHGVGWAFDAPWHAQGLQQMAHQRGFARAQVAVQGDKGLGQGRVGHHLVGQLLGKGGGIGFTRPGQRDTGVRLRALGGIGHFYNRALMHAKNHSQENQAQASQAWLARITAWAKELGFSQIGVAGVDLSSSEPGLLRWLEQGFHGQMHYMAAHGLKRARPAELVPGTVSVITARMNYLPADTPADWQEREWQRLRHPQEAIISVYARGRDYHKVLRARLQKLAERMAQELGPFGYRAFTDSAPVLEAELARRSGQGWRGKHSLVLNREAGSTFFLGEIYVDLPLPPTEPVSVHCGSCTACLDACPTGAIVAPGQVDARRCISYLTIEYGGSIPEDLRPKMANRIYGCDDCQLACPWNKFAQPSVLADFAVRPGLQDVGLAELFAWDEASFLRRTEGSPIRRIGHEKWLRNIAVALGNALRQAPDAATAQAIAATLATRLDDPSALVREHVQWALAQHPRLPPAPPF